MNGTVGYNSKKNKSEKKYDMISLICGIKETKNRKEREKLRNGLLF